jgi:ABC-type glycerol-3-phosphate transport system substrate-binding protein
MRKRMIFKVLLIAFALVLAFTMVYAKGNSGDDKAPDAGKMSEDKAPEPVELVFWWWGEQEAVGLTGWLDETVALFEKEYPHITVETVLQATENVIDDFTTASAAGTPPDLQYLWNGIYHQENVWLGYVEPLNDWIPEDELKHMFASDLSFYQGKQYRAGWYLIPMVWIYSKKLFKEAGVPESLTPPKTWDDLIQVCDILKGAGIIPIGAGFKDGFWGEWYTGHGLVQQEDAVSDTTKLLIGEHKWSDPRWNEHWVRLEELITAGYFNDDANSLDLYQGIELIHTGKAAMGQSIGTLVPAAEEAHGKENIGVMKYPTFGIGKLADLPIIDVQGVGISSQSEHKAEAALFIRFMHRPDRLTALYEDVHIFPANDTWDGTSVIKDNPNNLQMWKWFTGKNTAYIPNMIAWTFDAEVMYITPQMMIAGTATADDTAKLSMEVIARWREENPDLLESHKNWAGVE